MLNSFFALNFYAKQKYLLTWNPKNYYWDALPADIQEIEETGVLSGNWSTGSRKSIQEGDRLFLIRLGKEPRGIMASGWATSGVYNDTAWNIESPKQNALYVDLDFDAILDPEKNQILQLQTLKTHPILQKKYWEQQSSGTNIPDEVAEELEKIWKEVLTHEHKIPIITPVIFPEEIDTHHTYYEGTSKQITVNSYERNPKARAACIKIYGWSCVVCGFNFQETYGERGVNFIHVHHLKALSDINEAYEIDPKNDLRPICPNCHAMIHRTPACTIEELRKQIKKIT